VDTLDSGLKLSFLGPVQGNWRIVEKQNAEIVSCGRQTKRGLTATRRGRIRSRILGRKRPVRSTTVSRCEISEAYRGEQERASTSPRGLGQVRAVAQGVEPVPVALRTTFRSGLIQSIHLGTNRRFARSPAVSATDNRRISSPRQDRERGKACTTASRHAMFPSSRSPTWRLHISYIRYRRLLASASAFHVHGGEPPVK